MVCIAPRSGVVGLGSRRAQPLVEAHVKKSVPTRSVDLVKYLLVAASLVALFVAPVSRTIAQDASPAATPAAGPGLQGAIDWMVPQQSEDGGYPGFEGTSDPTATTNYIIALAAAGAAGIDVAEPLDRAWGYMSEQALVYAQSGAVQSAMLSLAAAAAGQNPSEINGVLPLTLATSLVNETTGLYGSGVYDHAIILMAMAVAGEAVPPAAVDALKAVQIADGSWAFDATTTEGAGDSNTTAMVIQALVAIGEGDNEMIAPAVAYLATTAEAPGRYGYSAAEPVIADANSTALVVQALIATGVDVEASGDLAGLASFQNPSGAFRYQDADPADNAFATVQAVPALAIAALPVVGAGGASTPTAIFDRAA